MECCKADHLIMKYMDKVITEQEANDLHEHIAVCAACKQDFIVYDEIVDVFSEEEWSKAPENFENKVMEQIRHLAPLSQKATATLDNLWCAVWGVFSILLGIGTLITLNSGSILEYMSQNPKLSPFAIALKGLSDDISVFAGDISDMFYSMISSASGYLASTRLFLSVVLVILATAQFFIYRKDKVKA